MAPNVPWIGVDRGTVTWLQCNGYPRLKMSKVEEEHYSSNEENRTKDMYLWNKRIAIDAILAQGGGLRKYLVHQITTISPIRDYTPIIKQPETEALYPRDVRLALANVKDFVNGFVEDKWEQIQDNEQRSKRKTVKTKKERRGHQYIIKTNHRRQQRRNYREVH